MIFESKAIICKGAAAQGEKRGGLYGGNWVLLFWEKIGGGGGWGDGPFHRLVSSDFENSGANFFVLGGSTIGDQVLGSVQVRTSPYESVRTKLIKKQPKSTKSY